MNSSEQYNELAFYTLSHNDMLLYFIHQHIVDAQTAQTADQSTKPISIVFALVGLYLTLEKGYIGKQVQQAHMLLAKNKKDFPHIILPKKRGIITVSEVLNTVPGKERDEMILKWCSSVWQAHKENRPAIIDYCSRNL